MKISQLISLLEEIQENLNEGEDPQVRLATQPNYPIATNVTGAYFDAEESDKVWLTEGSLPYDENGYAVPRDAWEEALEPGGW